MVAWWLVWLSVSAPAAVLETTTFRYEIASDGRNVALVDRATGTNYLRLDPPSVGASVRVGGTNFPVTAVSQSDRQLSLRFGTSGIEADLATEVHPTFVVLTLKALRGAPVEALTFLQVPFTLRGLPSETFGACAVGLNLFTRVDALPALQSEWKAGVEAKFGLLGAKVALVAGPTVTLLATLRDVLAQASELPVCRVAGPWARDTDFAHGSYLFNFGALDSTNVETWIETVKSLGFTQTDHHGGNPDFFRFGDFELNRAKWPDGWQSFRRVTDRMHAAGIGSIFHTYAFFIDKHSRYVTPVPDARLDAFRSFTLAEPLSEGATEIVVEESTAGIRTTTGFFEQNSVVLHVGDELVTFAGATAEAPWKFTGVKRGALGTHVAAHDRGARARHLKEMFGLFVPDVDSTLFAEIAANHARVVEEGGFDGIYLDAIDGSGILRGNDEFWYWAQKFVVEIQRHLTRPVGMEMSAMAHQFWQYRTRWQAWDYPRRGHRRFLDEHAAGVDGGLLLPLHLGWWNLQAFEPPQSEPTYPDVMEQLGARLIGWDAGISLTASVNRGSLKETPLFRRAVETLRQCEELRHAKRYDERARARLRDPRLAFALESGPDGARRFRVIESQPQTVAMAEPWTHTWNLTNSFAAQPARFRIEALMAADRAPARAQRVPGAGMIEDAAWERASARGVTWNWESAPAGGRAGGWFVATNAGVVLSRAAWARATRRFEPTLDLRKHQALQVDIEGDGSGALVSFRFESPAHIGFGGVADRYVKVDFVGSRSFVLVETEAERWSDFTWDDGKGLYQVYREGVHFESISSMSLGLQNLPASRPVRIHLGPVHAVSLVAEEVRQPRLIIDGASLLFPVRLTPGSWIEANGPDDCLVYGPKGESLGNVVPRGDWPTLRSGVTAARFECEPGVSTDPRARVVLVTRGDSL